MCVYTQWLTLRFSKFRILCSIITNACRIGELLSTQSTKVAALLVAATLLAELLAGNFSTLTLAAEGILYRQLKQQE